MRSAVLVLACLVLSGCGGGSGQLYRGGLPWNGEPTPEPPGPCLPAFDGPSCQCWGTWCDENGEWKHPLFKLQNAGPSTWTAATLRAMPYGEPMSLGLEDGPLEPGESLDLRGYDPGVYEIRLVGQDEQGNQKEHIVEWSGGPLVIEEW